MESIFNDTVAAGVGVLLIAVCVPLGRRLAHYRKLADPDDLLGDPKKAAALVAWAGVFFFIPWLSRLFGVVPLWQH
jgi:hypothetical protein